MSRKAVNNLIPETNNNLCNFNLNAQDRRLPNYINRTGQQPDRQFQHTQTTENIFLQGQAQQKPLTSSINLPKTQLKSFSRDPLRWHDWFSFFRATIHDNVTLTPTMIIRWNEYVLRRAIVQPNLIHFKDWIDNYAEACKVLSTSQRPTNQENSSSRKSNRFFQQQSNKRCPLCGYSHNLEKCNQFLNKDTNERQQTVRQLKICPNCLTEHPKGKCNSHYRCRIENCNGFHHSTIQQFADIFTNSATAKQPTATTSTTNTQPGSKPFCKQLSQQSWSTKQRTPNTDHRKQITVSTTWIQLWKSGWLQS